MIVCVPDLDEAVTAFERGYGVTSVPGGRHEGHGTANRLVPLGDTYVELVAVVDHGEAGDSGFGSWVAMRSAQPGADAIAIRTDDLDDVCRRLDLESIPMSRTIPTGERLHWRVAGMEHLISSGLPFFIQWDIDASLHPGNIPVSHGSGHVFLGAVVLSGDERLLRAWTEGLAGVDVEDGPPGVRFELADQRIL